MFTKTMMQAFVMVLCGTAVMCIVVYNGYFKTAPVDLGQKHYAEQVTKSWKPYLPVWMNMPLNTMINIGYVIVGAAWCAVTTVALYDKKITPTDSFFFYSFNLGSCFYGPIQALRILTQFHAFAVLDQWYTLPMFMWACVWGFYLRYGWSFMRTFILMVLSMLSYVSVVLIDPRDDVVFEICLALHIVMALIGAFSAWSRYRNARVGMPCLGAFISCFGFVVLKVMDLHLPKYHSVFKVVSGHFISKICDVLQIHYVNRYFLGITLAANMDQKKKKE